MSNPKLKDKFCEAVLEASKLADSSIQPTTELAKDAGIWSKHLKVINLIGKTSSGTNLGSHYLKPFWELIEGTNSFKEFSMVLHKDPRLVKRCGKECSSDSSHNHKGNTEETNPIDIINVALSECKSRTPQIKEVRQLAKRFDNYLSSKYENIHNFLFLENVEFSTLPIKLDSNSIIREPTFEERSWRQTFNPSLNPFFFVFHRIVKVKKNSNSPTYHHGENEVLRIFSLLHLVFEGTIYLPEYWYGNQSWRSTLQISGCSGGQPALPEGRGKVMRTSQDEVKVMKRYWNTISNLNWDNRDWPVISLNRFCWSYTRWSVEDRIVDLYSTLDSLFVEGNTELTFKLAITAARILGRTPADRKETFLFLKKSATARGGYLHSGRTKQTGHEKDNMEERLRQHVRDSLLIAINKVSKGWNEKKWEEFREKILYS